MKEQNHIDYNQPQVLALLRRNQKVIDRFARRVVNGVLDFEDARQELTLKIFHKLEKSPELLQKSLTAQDKTIYKVVKDRHTDLIRYYEWRLDTSKYTPGYTDAGVEFSNQEEAKANRIQFSSLSEQEPVFMCSDLPDTDEASISQTYFEQLMARVEKLEEFYPGITYYLEEALDPSPETEEQYARYQEEHKFAHQPGGNFIPPYTLIKFLDVSEGQLRKYHIALSQVLAQLGVPRASEIYQRLSY